MSFIINHFSFFFFEASIFCESLKIIDLLLQLSKHQHLPDLLHALHRIQSFPDLRRFRVPDHHQGCPPGDVDAHCGRDLSDYWLQVVNIYRLGCLQVDNTVQCSPLSLVEECRGSALIGREMLLRQLSYAIKNQLVASKAPY